MKKVLLISCFTSVVLMAGPICDFKIQQVQTQINSALEHNRKSQVSELRHALKELMHHCNDEKVLKKQKNEISKLEKKISETNDKISDLKLKGKTDKIREAEVKIKIFQNELDFRKKEFQKMQDISKGDQTQSKS